VVAPYTRQKQAGALPRRRRPAVPVACEPISFRTWARLYPLRPESSDLPHPASDPPHPARRPSAPCSRSPAPCSPALRVLQPITATLLSGPPRPAADHRRPAAGLRHSAADHRHPTRQAPAPCSRSPTPYPPVPVCRAREARCTSFPLGREHHPAQIKIPRRKVSTSPAHSVYGTAEGSQTEHCASS